MEDHSYSNNRGIYEIESYSKGWFIVLDATDENDRSTEHARCNQLIRSAFRSLTGYEIVNLQTSGPALEDWDLKMETLLEEAAPGDVFVYYYHGLSSGNGGHYKRLCTDDPEEGLSVQNFIDKISRAGFDFFFILDCWMSTRFRDKWNLEPPKGCNIEFIARGAVPPEANGTIDPLNGDFTHAVVRNMKLYHDKVVRHMRRVKPATAHWYQAPRSLPEIMMGDNDMDTNPNRVWLSSKKRIKFSPHGIRASGGARMEFFRVHPPVRELPESDSDTSDETNEEEESLSEEPLIEDEGFGGEESHEEDESQGQPLIEDEGFGGEESYEEDESQGQGRRIRGEPFDGKDDSRVDDDDEPSGVFKDDSSILDDNTMDDTDDDMEE